MVLNTLVRQRLISLSIMGFTLFALIGSATLTGCGKKKAANSANTDTNCNNNSSVFCFDPNNPALPGQTVYFGQTLNIQKHGVFQQVMEAYGGFCSRSNTIGSWNCENYDDEGYIIIQAVVGQPRVTFTIGAGLDEPPYGNYGGNGLGFNEYFREFSISNISVYDANNNQGMDMQTSLGVNNGIRGYVSSGKLTDDSFTIRLMFRGETFATADVVRYNQY